MTKAHFHNEKRNDDMQCVLRSVFEDKVKKEIKSLIFYVKLYYY